MTKRRYLSFLTALCLTVASMPMNVMAAPAESEAAPVVLQAEEAGPEKLSYEGYHEVWRDDFSGDALDTSVWNIEEHPAGWVNEEWQEYVTDNGNIVVNDGKLSLIPKKEIIAPEEVVAENIIPNADFADGFTGWTDTSAWGTAVASHSESGDKVTYDITSVGGDGWEVQLKSGTFTLEPGTNYTLHAKVKSTKARKIELGVMDGAYQQYQAENLYSFEDNETKDISVAISAASKVEDAIFYVTMGVVGGITSVDPHTIEISEISLVADIPETAGEILTNGDFSDGKNGWTETIAIAAWGGSFHADASSEVVNHEAVFTINDVGDDNWNVQLKQTGFPLTAGHNYEITFDAASDIDRTIEYALMENADSDAKWYAGDKKKLTSSLNGTDKTTIKFNANLSADEPDASLQVNMGKVLATEAYPSHHVYLSNFKIVDLDAQEGDGDDGSEAEPEEKVRYTSGRISTQNKKTFTYGLFEARAKVPSGAGYLPAFWLMANDENVYGQWPRCGEIDCMEVMGDNTKKAYGTIHYGESTTVHGSSQGTYVLGNDADFANEYHDFACEWEPGSIKWYVDGNLYHEEHDWYSRTAGQGTLSYPAPFDQPFYVILNLAVGGSWVGYPDENTSFDNNPFEIDYVKVSQKDSYDEDVEKPVKEVVLRSPDADGNYIVNGDFAVAEALDDTEDWVFMNALGGEATAAIADKTLTVSTTKQGTADYSVQLVQANIPLETGAIYEVSYDAYASAPRTMNVDVKAPDRGYSTYTSTRHPQLTTEKQTFTYEFKMTEETDANARLEFNMGAMDSTATIYLSNVSFKKVAEPEEEEEVKGLLSNGSYIYNGRFQEGKNHLGYWNIAKDARTTAAVTDFADGRRLKVVMPEKDPASFTLSQENLGFTEGKEYAIAFEAEADRDLKLNVSLGGKNHTVAIAGGVKQDYKIKIPVNTRYANHDVAFTLSESGTLYLDNITMKEDAKIVNGSFDDGTLGYEIYIDSAASATAVVDSMSEDNALDLTINKTGADDWRVQIKQNNVLLEQGKTYKLKWDAKSSMNRKIRTIMQGGEVLGWPVYSNDNVIELTNEWKTFEDTFTMTADTDPAAFLSICLGKVDVEINDQHRVLIDNISLVEVGGTSGDGGNADGVQSIDEIADVTYTGAAIKPVVKVYDGETLLTEGKDYTVAAFNNVDVNAKRKVNSGMGADFDETLPYVIVSGKGNYSGEQKANFNINRYVLAYADGVATADCAVEVNEQMQVASKAQDVFKSLKVNKKTLQKDQDFTLNLVTLAAKDANGAPVANNTVLENAQVPAGYTGSFALKIEGKGNYTGVIKQVVYAAGKGNLMKNAKITLGKNLKNVKFAGKNIVLKNASYDATARKYYEVVGGVVTGTEINAADAYVVKSGNDCLIEGRDFKVTYKANKAVGTATMTLTGIGAYYGSVGTTFKIVGAPFKANTVVVTGLNAEEAYTGKPVTQTPVLYYQFDDGQKRLRAGSDYTVSYKKNIKKGTASIIFTGRGTAGYTGSVVKKFKIVPVSIADEAFVERAFDANTLSAAYSKSGAIPEITLKLKSNGTVLRAGVDYKLSAKNNKAIADRTAQKAPTLIVKGIGCMNGSFEVPFSIEKANLNGLRVDIKPVQMKSGDADTVAYTPVVKLFDGKKALSDKTDYVIEYVNNTKGAIKNGETPKVIIKAKDGSSYFTTANIEMVLPIFANKLKKGNTKVVIGEAVYNGSKVTPTVHVYYSADKNAIKAAKNVTAHDELIALGLVQIDSDVALAYGANNVSGKNKGIVIVTGTSTTYGGSFAVKFDIAAKGL